MIVDSHCHLDSGAFNIDREEVIDRAREAGVGLMLTIGTGHGPPELDAAIRLADRHDDIYATVGVHPHDAAKATDETYAALRDLAQHEKVLAIGEIGLDYHYEHSPREVQAEVFRRQIELAQQLKKPIIIHTRDAWEYTLAALREQWAPAGLPGIMHCFTGSAAQADEAVALGFYISFAGVLTYKRSDELREAAARVPLDRILVETDAPYLTPEPHRKIRRNEPRFVTVTAEKLATTRGLSYEDAVAATTRNFRRLFDLPEPS